MIELAPRSKVGLPLANPIMIAAGCGGYGDVYPLIDLSVFGALVTNPITLRPRRGAPQPRLVETTAGFILNTGGHNPGVKKVLQQHRTTWRRLGIPVIAHLPADEPGDLRRTARALCDTESTVVDGAIAAIELEAPSQASPRDVERWVEAIREGCLLPLLIKLPLADAAAMAQDAAGALADALVVGSPPPGAAVAPATGQIISGDLYGPAVHSLALHQLLLVKQVVDIPIVAVGGIHSAADARAFLEAGAAAVQLDSLLFVEPQLAYDIACTFQVSNPGPEGY